MQMTDLLFSHQYPVQQLLSTQHDPLSIIASATLYPICFGNVTIYLLIVSYFTFYILLVAIEYWRKLISISYALLIYYLYFALLGMDQFKQIFALSIALLAIAQIYEGKYLKFLMLTIIAGLFHSTAFVALIFLVFKLTNAKRRVIKSSIIILMVVLGLYSELLFNVLASLFGNTAYSSYFTGYLFQLSLSNEGTGLGFLVHLAPCFFALLFYKHVPENVRWLVSFGLISAFPLRMLGYVSTFLLRLYYIPAIVLVIAYPSISRSLPKSQSPIFNFATLGLFVIYYYSVFSTSHGVTPYSLII